MNIFVNELLRIVGNEDGTGGEHGVVEVTGDLARCIILELGVHPHSLLHGAEWEHPVRVSRFGNLDIWVNGCYTEGSRVSKIVHNAVRRYEQNFPNQRETDIPRH